MPDSWLKAFLPTMALLYWTGKPVTFDTSLETRLSMVVLMPVVKGMMSLRTFSAITISSSAALPARSPMPLMVHSTWRAPASTPARELATARPRSLWTWVEKITLSALGTRLRSMVMMSKYSCGVE